MQQAAGELVEIYLENGLVGGRLLCPPGLVPSVGRYLLGHDPASDSPLAAPVFSAGSAPGGFLIAPSIPAGWHPGLSLSLHGPLGHGFSLPEAARCVALIPLGETAARLKPLIPAALRNGASVVVVTDLDLPALPSEVEVQPVSALPEVAKWADYMALDLPRESLSGLREKLGSGGQAGVGFDAQALVLTPMPCGGLAECGVCAITTRQGWKMACKDGPVFDLKKLP